MKIKLSQKNIFRYLYIAVALAVFFLIYQVYDFGMNQVYNTIYTSDYVGLLQNKKYITDLNVSGFNDILENLKKKSGGIETSAISPAVSQDTGTSSSKISN